VFTRSRQRETIVKLILVPFLMVAVLTVASAKQPSPPPPATFFAEACVDVATFEVTATATWSKARLHTIQFWAFGGNGFFLGETNVNPDKDRNGSITVSWVPPLSVANGIPTDQLQVNFYDWQDRWTEVVGLLPVGPC
jgi:hypothetical protein